MESGSAEHTVSTDRFEQQVGAGDRFQFGENWQRFLAVLNEERLAEAERSLREMLRAPSLVGKSFLDVGSGSGLFSLAAVRLGASAVHSIDFDPTSVACTREVKRRLEPSAEDWTIERGNVLDDAEMAALGQWDIVYAWGVLHHTGDMRTAMENVAPLVAPTGRLFISIYNDQGLKSRLWRRVKQVFNTLPAALRGPFVVAVMAPFELRAAFTYSLAMNPSAMFASGRSTSGQGV